MLAASERHEHTLSVPELDPRVREDSDVRGRALEECDEALRQPVRAEPGWSIEEHKLDGVGRREANGVAGRIDRGESRSPHSDVQRRDPCIHGGGRASELALVCEQTGDDQLSRRERGQRLSDCQKRVELLLVRGKNEHRPTRLGRGSRMHPSGSVEFESRVLGQDCPLELVERGRGLDAELLDERLPRPSVDIKRFCLSPRAVEGEHQLPAEALAKGMLRGQRLQLRDELGVAAERELGLDAVLYRREPDLLEPPDRGLRKGLVPEVGERCSSPQRERLAEKIESRSRVPSRKRLTRLFGPALEALQVELLRREANDVSGRTRLDHGCGAERLAELGDLPLHLRDGRDRSGAGVEIVGESLNRHDLVCVE